jgi:malonyl CoA-acyl carrier protein transacylase
MSVIYLFPGQGSQFKGMGKGLFEAFPDLTQQADRQLGYSIKELCLEDRNDQLRQTQFTQPALYVVNALTYLGRKRDGAGEPDFLAGHSLGEYSALFASGAFDFITGLRLVQKRGELMAQVTGGGMAAIVGMKPSDISALLENFGFDNIDVANFNSDRQTVISGPKADIEEAMPIFKESGATPIALKVSGAFHSRMMQPTQEAFGNFLKDFKFSEPRKPVIANATAERYSGNNVGGLLVQQLASPVRWTETIRYFLGQSEPKFEEVGPGKVLTGLLKDIQKDKPSETPAPVA